MPTPGLERSISIGTQRVEGSGEEAGLKCLTLSLVKKPQPLAFVGGSQLLWALNETQKFLQPLKELNTVLNTVSILNTNGLFNLQSSEFDFQISFQKPLGPWHNSNNKRGS